MSRCITSSNDQRVEVLGSLSLLATRSDLLYVRLRGWILLFNLLLGFFILVISSVHEQIMHHFLELNLTVYILACVLWMIIIIKALLRDLTKI